MRKYTNILEFFSSNVSKICNNLSFLVLICLVQMVLFATVYLAGKLCEKVQIVGCHDDG